MFRCATKKSKFCCAGWRLTPYPARHSSARYTQRPPMRAFLFMPSLEHIPVQHSRPQIIISVIN
ncbi:hypothetical protein CKO_04944 [Citrobacter koseri ATCC BAA-895]|uniref:Uncharacterized protein n=1 Tax=Citrobacter koseri (strain ATCC BAA-895 / CDC 4225-83 / SGSC4696) TaxID=290338 RepID=A8AR75_CITK8|nr:hypothetical protein CKO_04944 [Citrobacter koseri ATCC BAA-895]